MAMGLDMFRGEHPEHLVFMPLKILNYSGSDPNLQYLCRGSLSDYAACQCKEDEGEVACINAQFVDTDVFFNLNAHYKSLQKVTFHGNNFQDLPSTSLFGSVLDLSYNFLQSVPFELPCPFPSLTSLDLRQNFLKNLVVNGSCLTKVRSVDLSRNQFYSLTSSFRHLASSAQPDTYVLRNPFHCDCKSNDYVTWIRDKHTLVCDRASPRNFVGARLVEVPLHKLDCSERTEKLMDFAHREYLKDFVCAIILEKIFQPKTCTVIGVGDNFNHPAMKNPACFQ
ncbi:leucine Rich repeat-containing domain protein [Ancylostoma ceylanicum]|uniref:Leucine Rich repeat-containing domain protein n=1 Tax=Ancylostoma ceylanicum TaxID=53326 RepID=A0A0D6L792_9BILA|nr:leucine Rich repeat-containing domain protein [Ancylostoma ceylanicum]